MKRILSALLLAAVLFSGCVGNGKTGMELSERLIVEAIGIDPAPRGVLLTLLTLNPTGRDGATQKTALLTFEAQTVAEAAFLAQASTGKPPFFAHARVLIIGQSAAEAGILPHLDFFLHNRTVRNTVPVCVAEPSAEVFLRTEFTAFASAAEAAEQALRTGIPAGACVNAPFYGFINRILSADTNAYCPLVRTESPANGGEPVLSIGKTAVFREDRFAFSVGRDETFALSLLSNEVSDTLVNVPHGIGEGRFRLLKPKTRVRKTQTENVLELSVTVPAVLVETQNARSAAEDDPDRNAVPALQNMLHTLLEQSLGLLYQTQKTDLLRLRRKGKLPPDVPPEALTIRILVEIETE